MLTCRELAKPESRRVLGIDPGQRRATELRSANRPGLLAADATAERVWGRPSAGGARLLRGTLARLLGKRSLDPRVAYANALACPNR